MTGWMTIVATAGGEEQGWARSDLTGTCVVVGVVSVVVLVMGVRGLWRIGRAEKGRGAASVVRDGHAVAMLEFALVLPVLLFLGLLLTQTTLLMGAETFINYAAFAATRSAIVQIPTAYPDDAANQYTPVDGHTKYEKIRQAAVFAVVPISGELNDVTHNALANGLEDYYRTYGMEVPVWVENMMEGRLAYAEKYTWIRVDGSFGPRDPITVVVRHGYHLAIPWVNRIYSDDRTDEGGMMRMLTASCTLTNEGVVDALPPAPVERHTFQQRGRQSRP